MKMIQKRLQETTLNQSRYGHLFFSFSQVIYSFTNCIFASNTTSFIIKNIRSVSLDFIFQISFSIHFWNWLDCVRAACWIWHAVTDYSSHISSQRILICFSLSLHYSKKSFSNRLTTANVEGNIESNRPLSSNCSIKGLVCVKSLPQFCFIKGYIEFSIAGIQFYSKRLLNRKTFILTKGQLHQRRISKEIANPFTFLRSISNHKHLFPHWVEIFPPESRSNCCFDPIVDFESQCWVKA